MNPGDLLIGIIAGVRRKWGILPKGDEGQVLTMVDDLPTWADAGEASHPNLAAHDTLGLATQAELDTHTNAAHPPANADYLVGSSQAGLSAEIVVGTSPGGELGGTWASPTVDATHAGSAHHDPVTVGTGLDVTGQLVELDLSEVAAGGELGGFMDAPTVDASHSGSTHAATQAAAEATAATALSGHEAAGDPHAGYRLESVPIAAADVAADVATQAELDAVEDAAADALAIHAGAADPHTGYVQEDAVPGGELGGTYAVPTVDASHSGSTHAATQAAAEATAAGALSSHAGAADPHTGYQKESEKGAASGYASLDAGTKVPTAELGGAGADASKFLRGDQTWAAPAAALSLTTVEVSLGAAPYARRSGRFTISGAGLTAGKPVLIQQAAGPYTGKGTRADEAEMDLVTVTGKVLNATTIECFWNSQHRVRGNFKFDYAIGA